MSEQIGRAILEAELPEVFDAIDVSYVLGIGKVGGELMLLELAGHIKQLPRKRHPNFPVCCDQVYIKEDWVGGPGGEEFRVDSCGGE